jgi:hypothetical protein
MSDHEFDQLALSIDLSVDTGNVDMDFWFICNFQPHTGSWIWKHPNLQRLEELYWKWYAND